MSAVYDSWERLVRATLRRDQLSLIAQRTPSDLSLESSSSSFNFTVPSGRLSPRNFPRLLSGKTFKYDEILRATNYFSQSNLIKHGRSGDLFRGVSEGGTRVVIKRIDLWSPEKELYCISELRVLGQLSDCGLVPLVGHCLENWYEMYLVYKYMPNRDLSTSFFSIISFEPIVPSMNWRNRLRIATGIAQALSVLHHQCVPPLVHGDIQASSLLLDYDFEVRLCSLGVVCTQERESNQTRITRFHDSLQGSNQGPSGTSNATCPYDVYCFGKVLLELVTGKRDAAANSSIMQDLMNEHPQNTPERKDPIGRIIDQFAFMDMPELKVEVLAAAMIAKACLNPEPSKRPLMANVLMALRNPLTVFQRTWHPTACLASPPGLVGTAFPKTVPKRSKLTRLLLGTWLSADVNCR